MISPWFYYVVECLAAFAGRIETTYFQDTFYLNLAGGLDMDFALLDPTRPPRTY
jgi:hypothetical protein